MGMGRYHDTAAFRKSERESAESFKMFLGLLFLPFLIIYYPLKWIFGSRKKRRG